MGMISLLLLLIISFLKSSAFPLQIISTIQKCLYKRLREAHASVSLCAITGCFCFFLILRNCVPLYAKKLYNQTCHLHAACLPVCQLHQLFLSDLSTDLQLRTIHSLETLDRFGPIICLFHVLLITLLPPFFSNVQENCTSVY
jgi:drug/metabolite transporter superfamily protein YnfA